MPEVMNIMFPRWLQEQMDVAGINQNQLSKIAHINQAAISRLLAGKTSPTAETCQAIAKALKLPPETVYREAGLLPPVSEDDELDAKIKHVIDSYHRVSTRKRALRLLETLLTEEQEEETDNRRGRAIPPEKLASSRKG